jgi:cytidylate kinase
MDNFFQRYLQNRFAENQRNLMAPGLNPFITFSREYGCPSKVIAGMLAESLNKIPGREKTPKWQFINKEILNESAKKLELDTSKVKKLISTEGKGIMDDLFASFSDHYQSNLRVKKTLREVIRSYAHDGYVIIVGRGGVAITRSFPRSLHIRLQAPIEWRTKEIMEHNCLSEKDAMKLIAETDKNRTNLITTFLGHPFDNSLFDATFNCQSLSKEEISATILRMMEVKKLV